MQMQRALHDTFAYLDRNKLHVNPDVRKLLSDMRHRSSSHRCACACVRVCVCVCVVVGCWFGCGRVR